MSVFWRKCGLLYEPRPLHPLLVSHAANPVAVPLEGDVFRVFFSGRDVMNRSSVGSVDIDIVRREIVAVADVPAFRFGPEGSFYSHGVSIGCLYEVDGVRYIPFMGWHIPPGGHWVGEIGRIRLNPDLSLSLCPEGPLLGIGEADPISLSYPWVFREPSGSWRMWYGSTVTWDAGNGEMVHILKHATSEDGHSWQPTGDDVPHMIGTAQAFSRPTILAGPSGFDMWFSYRNGRGTPYRIGHAQSPDGLRWELNLDRPGIDVGSTGWDSEMIEYPFVFAHRGLDYMLYNGNGFGLTGFGLAIGESCA